MDPVSLSVGAIVAALIAKAAERAEDATVGAAAHVLGRLAGWLRQRLSGGGAVVTRLQDAPDSPSRLEAVANAVNTQAQDDPTFATELRLLIEQAQQAGVDVPAVTQTAWGNQNVQITDVAGSDIRISFGPGGTPPVAR